LEEIHLLNSADTHKYTNFIRAMTAAYLPQNKTDLIYTSHTAYNTFISVYIYFSLIQLH